MTTIYFIRHGEYENPHRLIPLRMKGFPLSQKGKNQIREVGNFLKDKKIKIIYSSPILRTKQSAQILSDMLHIPIYFSKSLLEVYSPGLQGKDEFVIKEVEKYGDSFVYPPYRDNGGETMKHVYSRMKRMVKKVLEKHADESVVCVVHGDPLMTYHILASGNIIDKTHRLKDYDSYIPKAGVIRMEYEKGKFTRKSKINY